MSANAATRSYLHGTSDDPLTGDTVDDLLTGAAAGFGNEEAVVVPYQNVRWSYREFAANVERAAAGLLALGLRPGDRLGIWAPNCIEWVVLQFATARAGIILVNINPGYRLTELEHALQSVDCAALAVAPGLKSSDYIGMLYEQFPDLIDCEPGQLRDSRFESLRWIIRLDDQQSGGMFNYRALLRAARRSHYAELKLIARQLQFDDPINIQFTSGTTGAPKAATLTHHNIVNNALMVGRRMKLGVGDRMCIPVPMYHCFGMVLGTLCCVAHGATIVLSSPSFSARAVLETVQAERCTALHGVPTMFIAELDDERFTEFDLSTLRTGIIAGAPCPEQLMCQVMRDMHLDEITIAYGMTETGPVSTQTRTDDPFEQRVNTVGRVLPHTEIKVVDEQGRVVPRGQAGELFTRGYCVMRGYWNDPIRTAEALDDAGWIASGDVAVIDEDGWCRIVGRRKDMLIRGGENIFPREIEEFLYQHPKVDAVEVIGVPDPAYGEEICAWIRLLPGETASAGDIREFCKGRIAHYKIPRYVKFVDEFPMTVTGKVQKYAMREQMARELNNSAHAGSAR